MTRELDRSALKRTGRRKFKTQELMQDGKEAPGQRYRCSNTKEGDRIYEIDIKTRWNGWNAIDAYAFGGLTRGQDFRIDVDRSDNYSTRWHTREREGAEKTVGCSRMRLLIVGMGGVGSGLGMGGRWKAKAKEVRRDKRRLG